MTPGMQIRLWYRRATARERQITAVAFASVVVLLIGSIVVRPSSEDVSQFAAVGTSNDRAIAIGGTAGSAATAAADGTPVTGGGTPVTGGGTPVRGGGNQLGAGGAAPSGPTTGDQSQGSVPRTASDRGVTPEAVKIGFLVANVGGLDATGFALDIRTDTAEYIQALADSMNKSGGINGRRVDVAVRKTDLTSQSDQAAACQYMVNDAKVFGVVDVGALTDTPAFECVATKNQTPYVHNTIWSTDWLARSGGMEVGYQAAIDRISKTWSRDLSAMGWIGDDAVVGILGDNCPGTGPIIDNVLKPDFEKLPGVTKVVVAKHDCDPQSVASQPPSFVTQFRLEDVTHVVVAMNFVSLTVFASTAEQQLYRPKYTVSDWWQGTSDASAANFDPNQFDGAIGISSLGMMLPASGKAPYPGGEWCQKVATDAGLEPLEYDGRNHELWAMCDNFLLMVDGIRNAGANPTRAAWAQAIQALGSHPSVLFGPSTFGPGKVTGSDQVHTIQWQRGCTCFKSISEFRPAAA